MTQKFSSAIRAISLAAGAFCLASSALAVPTYGNIVSPPGVIFGSGNVNGNFTINIANNVEVALRAKNRYSGATVDGSDGTYNVEGGACGLLPCGGATSAFRAKWNYEFAVNVRADGTGSDLSAYEIELMVDTDPTSGVVPNTLNVITNWGDNSFWNGTARRNGTPGQPGPIAGEFALQQSANPFFPNSGFGFVPADGLYDLTLSVYQTVGTARLLRSSVTTQLQVPEPGSLALTAAALAAALVVRRRRTA